MDKLQKYQPTGLSRLDRLKQAVRAYWMGPIMSSDARAREFFGGHPTSTGLDVTEFTALNYSAVFAAVGLISSQVGNLPLLLYRKAGEGKERFERHPLYRLIHDRPNPDMSAFVFRETLQAHVLTWGNGYAEIQRDGAGRPSAFWPITPDRVTPFRRGSDAPLEYRIANRDGGEVFIPQGDMIHVPGHGFDGICGYSVIAKMRESIGLGLAAERFGGTFFGNGATFGGVISYLGAKPPELAEKNYRDTLNSQHQGVTNSHKFLALYNGAKYERLGIPPNDAQFLETRQFQIAEIARWFNLPPHKLKELSRSTNNNIEHQNLEYYIDCLAPWLERWEQELCEKLISPLERTQQSIEFVADGLLRGDAASRGDMQSKQFSVAMLTPNEGRKLENRNPLKGGDTAFVALNMIPLHLVEEWTQAEIDSKKADAEAKRRPPPAPVVPSATPDPGKAREIERLTEERDAARKIAQDNEEAKDLAVHERDRLAGHVSTLQAEQDALVAARATDRADFSGQIETLRSDLAGAQAVRDQALVAKDAAEAARSAAAVDLARVQLVLETEQRDRIHERNEAVRTVEDREATIGVVSTARDAADRVALDLRTRLAEITIAHETAVRLVSERTEERDALTQQVDGLSTQIESLSLDVTVAQRATEATEASLAETRTALAQMTAQAANTGRDLATALTELADAKTSGQRLTADYTRVCDETQTVLARAETTDAIVLELRTQVVALTAERAALTSDLATATEQRATAVKDLASARTYGEMVEADYKRVCLEKIELEKAMTLADTFAQGLRAEIGERQAQATALGTDLTAAHREHAAAVDRAQKVEAGYQRVCGEHQALTVRADTADAIVGELRTQVATLTAESAALTTALAEANEQRGRAEEAKAEALRKQETADTAAAAHETVVRQLRERESATQHAIRGVLVDAASRLLARESDRARKAQGSPDKLAKWIDVFYPMHEDVCRTVLRPAVSACLIAAGIDLSVDRMLDRVVPPYLSESTRTLRGLVAETDAESLMPALERVLRRWDTERSEAFADRIMKEAANGS